MMHRRLSTALLASTALTMLGTPTLLRAGSPTPPAATTLPQGPQTQAGSATYTTTPSTNTLTINQSSQNLITNWSTFNIGSSATVNFQQPNSSAIALNRVVGDTNPSQIFGTLTANGIVFLVNPNGILFGQGAQVNVGSLLVTTHDIKNSDFLAGKYNFTIPGTATASVVNQGKITAASGGFAALVAPGVRNTGTITATLGTVGLAASGQGFTLDMYGDKLITLAVGDQIAGQVIDVSTGQPLSSYVSNEGKLKANGGRVELTAAAARTVVTSVINNTGVIEANSVGTKNGTIVLGAATAKSKPAGAPTQTVNVAGRLSAKGKKAGETGGNITITGENISLTGAKLNASGQVGGGKVLVGMNVPVINQYMTPTSTAATVTIDSASTINVSAKGSTGNGGVIGIWSDNATSVSGSLLGTGGLSGGTSGNAYILGAQSLAFAGTANLSSAANSGSNQSDQDKLFIASGNDLTITANPSGLPTGASYVTVSALQSSLANSTVSVNAGLGTISMPGFTTAGNLTVASSVAWSSLSSLKLQANQDITINSGVVISNSSAAANPDIGSVTNQNINLYAGQSGTGVGTVKFLGDGTQVDVSQSYANVNITYNPPGGYANPTNYAPYIAVNTWLDQPGFVNAAMLVNNATDLQNVNQNLAGSYVVSQNIDAGSIANFVPIGNAATPFTGSFYGNGSNTGNGYSISNLTINATGGGPVGLFGQIGAPSYTNCYGTCGSSGSVNDVNLVNVRIAATGASAVGALAGVNYGTIWQSSASGSVSNFGSGPVGGLVGINASNGPGWAGPVNAGISSSSANVTVTGGSGNADSQAAVGGLVGLNSGSIWSSLATGNVTGGSWANVGGLVGYNSGSIQDTYAIGAVTGGSNSYVGGLVGYLAGSGYGSGYCDCALVAPSGTIQTSWASGLVSAAPGSSNVTLGGLVGGTSYYSWDAVAANVTNSYWDMDTTQQSTSAGGTGLSASGSSPFAQASYAGFDFGNTWFMIDGQTRPFLQSEWSSTITNAHQLQLMALDPTARYVLLNNVSLTASLANPSDMWNSTGFAPIGGNNVNGFTGYLLGLNNTIDGLTITSSASSLGLFGLIGPGGTVNGVNLTNVNITATGSNQTVGALAATNEGAIGKSSVTGTLSGLGDGMTVGGLVGFNAGVIKGSSATVTASVGNGSSDGGWNYLGGLVGYNGVTLLGETTTLTGKIRHSSASGMVSGGSSSFVGGLVGQSDGSIYAARSSAVVIAAANSDGGGSASFGGLVGYNTGRIALSSASGNVDGGVFGNFAGGLAGQNLGVIVTSSASGNVTGSGPSSDVYALIGGLVGQNGNSNADGTSGIIAYSSATGIVNGGDYTTAGGLVGTNLTNAIILNSFATGAVSTGNGGYAGGLVGDNFGAITGDGGFPVATLATSTVGASFATGNVTTTEDATGVSLGGLAGGNEVGAVIQNTVANGNVTGGYGSNIGGLVGQNNGQITTTLATGTVSAGSGSTVGGLAGFNSGTVSQSFATGAVTGDSNVGGLVGLNYSGGTVTLSYATGAVTGNSSVGGLVGYNDSGATVSQSYATGAVTGTGGDDVGGLVGYNNGSVSQSNASGSVTGPLDVGGLVGDNSGGTVTSSYATGAVSGGSSWSDFGVGGLVGFMYGGSVSQSYATGPVAGVYAAGGLVGWSSGTVTQSYATGAVSGAAMVGGLVGYNIGGTITQSNATGAVTAGSSAFVGGLVGYSSGAISTTNASGNVSAGATSLIGGLVGGNFGSITNSFATGVVSGGNNSRVGGLVGRNAGSIDPSYATGAVVDTGTGGVLGGLVGLNVGSINQTAATGAVTGGTGSVVGGLVGVNATFNDSLAGMLNQSYASGAVTGGAGAVVGGLVGQNGATITQSYAVGQVTTGGGGSAGGLVGQNNVTIVPLFDGAFSSAPGTVTNSYYDTQTTGQQTSAGGIGQTTAQLTGSLPTGFDNPWTSAPASYPTLPGLPEIIPGPAGAPPVVTAPTDTPGNYGTQQTTNLTQVPTVTTDSSLPNFTSVNLGGLSGGPGNFGGTGGTGGNGGTGGTTGSTGGAGGNGAPPGTRLIDMPIIPLPPGSGMPPPGETRFINNEVVFQIGNGVSAQQVADIARRFGLIVVSSQTVDVLGRTIYTFRIVNGKSVRDIIRAIESSRVGGAVQPNYTFGLTQNNVTKDNAPTTGAANDNATPPVAGAPPAAQPAEATPAGTSAAPTPEDTLGDPAQYVIGKFQLGESHRLTRGDNVVVAVIDSEIDTSHPDLTGVVKERFDAGCAASAPDAHGTGMTGAIAAHQRLMGVAPNVKVIAICAFGGEATTESTSIKIIKGIDYAIGHGARVINMSFAGPRDPTLAQALQIAREKGIVLVGAAGNAGPKSPPLYPGADPNVIAVTATDDADRLFSRANQGKYIAVAAPGVDILAPSPNGGYQLTTGTSVATAHVSGVVALLLAQNPARTPDEIRTILMSTARDLGPKGIDPQFGAGLVDPLKALHYVPAQVSQKQAALAPAR